MANDALAGGELHDADVQLAAGCAAQEPAALAAFERVFAEAASALARVRMDDATADDVRQRVRARLLVGDGEGPKIASYAGRSPLLGWLRACLVHEAMSTQRALARQRIEDTPSVLDRVPLAHEQPELEHLRLRYAQPFRAAFAASLEALAPRDRNVLRLVYVEGMTAERVGALYGVHRVSVARWLGQIRDALFTETRRRMQAELRLEEGEFESLTRLCLSQIDVSLDRLLADLEAPAAG